MAYIETTSGTELQGAATPGLRDATYIEHSQRIHIQFITKFSCNPLRVKSCTWKALFVCNEGISQNIVKYRETVWPSLQKYVTRPQSLPTNIPSMLFICKCFSVGCIWSKSPSVLLDPLVLFQRIVRILQQLPVVKEGDKSHKTLRKRHWQHFFAQQQQQY